MEVKVFLSLESKSANKPVFGRMVLCPDAFDIKSFVQNMKAIFGNDCVIDILIV